MLLFALRRAGGKGCALSSFGSSPVGPSPKLQSRLNRKRDTCCDVLRMEEIEIRGGTEVSEIDGISTGMRVY